VCELEVDKNGKVHVKLFSTDKNGRIDIPKTVKHWGITVGIIMAFGTSTMAYFNSKLKEMHRTTFKPAMTEFVGKISYTKVQTDSVVTSKIVAYLKPLCSLQDSILKNQRIQIRMDIMNHGVESYRKAIDEMNLIDAGGRSE
jgi:hypothetical protein